MTDKTKTTTLPSNAKMEAALEKSKDVVERTEAELPSATAPKAKTIAQDVKNVLEDTQTLLREKNKGEKLQRIMKYGQRINQSGELTQQGKEMLSTVKDQGEGLKEEGNLLLISIRNLAWELITSPDFRESILDFFSLLQSVLWNVRERQAREQAYPPPTEAAQMEWQSGHTTFPMTQASVQEAAKQIGQEIQTREHFTEEEKEDLKRRLNRIFKRVSGNEHFRVACDSLFNIFDLYLKPMANDLKNKTEKPRDENLNKMWIETKAFVEEFTNGKSLDDFIDKFWDIYRLYEQDPEMNAFWHDFKDFFSECLQNPQMLQTDYTINRANELFERGRRLFNSEKHQRRFRELVDEGKDLVNRIQSDDDVLRFNEDITKLARDLAFDADGNPSFAQLSESLMQLRGVLGPLLQRALEEVPLPVLEGTTEKYRYRIENVNFTGGHIIPDQIRFHVDTDSYLKLRDELAPNELFAFFRVNIDNIDCDLKDIKFWLHKFKGTEWTDHGIFDLSARGISFEFMWRIRSVQGRPWKFFLENVNCTINKLKFNIVEAKHKFWDKFMTTIFITPLRKRMERSIEEFLIDQLKRVNRQFNQLFNAPAVAAGRSRIKDAVQDTVQKGMEKLSMGETMKQRREKELEKEQMPGDKRVPSVMIGSL